VHLVGSCYTDISRRTVNKTLHSDQCMQATHISEYTVFVLSKWGRQNKYKSGQRWRNGD